MNPKLSILIPAIPSRYIKAMALYQKIMNIVGDRDIEVLMLMDNKKRSIGEKRDNLIKASNGKYFMFVDDDDDLLNIDKLYAAADSDVDVITFKQRCRNQDGSQFIVTFGLGNEVESPSHNGRYLDCKRPPFHVCAWRSKFKVYNYPHVSYAEDWGWLQQVLPLAKTEHFIDDVIHSYNFDINVTEASTESNEIWTNPNGPQSNKVKPMETKRAIVNLVSRDKPVYLHNQQRMKQSLLPFQALGKFEVFTIIGEDSVTAPPHSENPYAFKIYAINAARGQGYKQIFWFDASIVAVKDLSPIWERLWKNGIFMEEAGHWVGTWCNEYTLKYFNITREQAMTIPMFAAGYVGFDFNHPDAVEFFASWQEAMLNGCFKGEWSNHRHDMTCASIIAYKMNLINRYGSGGEFFTYIGPGFGQPKETVVCELHG